MRSTMLMLLGWLLVSGLACNRKEARDQPGEQQGVRKEEPKEKEKPKEEKPKEEKPKEKRVEPLSDDVVKAWKDADVFVGWIVPDRKTFDFLQFKAGPWRPDTAGAVPGFRIGDWNAGMLAKLPVPATPFGIDLRSTEVTDEDLKELTGMKSLCYLELRFTEVSDAGLKHLAGLNNLTYLDLTRTGVTDAGLKELAGLKRLASLHLAGTTVTDAGLKTLSDFEGLSSLSVNQTGVTDEGVAGLKKALPRCKIQH